MNKSNLYFSTFFLLALSSCVLTESPTNIDGSLNLPQNLSITDKGGNTSNLKAGMIDSTIEWTGTNAKLSISTGLISSLDISFSSANLDSSGNFTASGSDSKQALSISGTILDNSQSVTETGSDQCLFRVDQITVCQDVRNNPGNPKDLSTHRECSTRDREIYGTQPYEGTRNTTDRNVELDLVLTSSSAKVGHFSGSLNLVNELDNKVYIGACHL